MNLLQYLVNPKAIKGDLHNLVTAPSRAFTNLAVKTSGAHILPYGQANPVMNYQDQPFHARPNFIPQAVQGVPIPPISDPAIPEPRLWHRSLAPLATPISSIRPVLPGTPNRTAITSIKVPNAANPSWTLFHDHQGNRYYENVDTGQRVPVSTTHPDISPSAQTPAVLHH